MAKKTAEAKPLTKNAERLHEFSRFFGQDLYIDGNRRVWGTWNPPAIPASPFDVYITVDQPFEARLDLYSYRFYQTPELWWVLAEANNIPFPFEELEPGVVLRIPSKRTLFSLSIIR